MSLRSYLSVIAVVMTSVVCLLFFEVTESWAGSNKEASKQNWEECRWWCKQNKPRCSKCLADRGCGAGWKQLKRFGGKGQNVYACEKRADTEARRTACNDWCSKNKPRCAHCSQKDACGVGRTIKSFRGKGINYFACEDRGRSEDNEYKCQTWCSEHHKTLSGGRGFCTKCQKHPLCDKDLVVIKSWKGKGKDWYACGDYAYVSGMNRSKCADWCNQNANCTHCTRIPGCGTGYKKLKSFTGRGDNYYACEDRGGSEENHGRCQEYCWKDRQCVSCSRYVGCGHGLEQIKVFRGKGKNWYACKKKKYSSGTLAPQSSDGSQ